MLIPADTLYLDAGNSRLKWGIAQDGREGAATSPWRAEGALEWRELERSRADGAGIQALLGALAVSRLSRVLLASVTTSEREAALARLLSERALPSFSRLTSEAAAAGVFNGYARPETLGIDRWCALIGARAQSGAPALVVMAGTAITLDALDAQGRFLGGFILPGLFMMRQALAAGAARLPLIPASEDNLPPDAFPADTGSAILYGALEAASGAIERAFSRFSARLTRDQGKAADAICFLSGGDAEALASRLAPLPLYRAPRLVLEGMRCLAR
ncbi:MAG: type III pantothenate kinase [Zoogloeaceae bacterium]|jgi:type III pantothenate kinase|nr:type III pantothenate kinase [Zoogloeaceae bacterium]